MQNHQHEKPIALALTLFLLVCQVCRWFTAPHPAQTRTGCFLPQRHPLITRRVLCPPSRLRASARLACTLYLVFKEPTPTGPVTRSRWPSPVSSGPSLGEPSKVTTEDFLCQYLMKFFRVARSGTKKLLQSFGATGRLLCRVSPAERRLHIYLTTIHALGVGFPRPLRQLGCQRILAEQAKPSPEPRARYLTCLAAAHIQAISVTSFYDHT